MTSGTALNRWLVVLVVLVVLAAAALVWALRDVRDGAATDVSSADATDAVVASSSVKESVRLTAATGARLAYSYSWRTLADDKDAARELMTPAMRDRYDRTMAGVTTSSRRDRTVVEAEVVETALVTASGTYARVLVFVNRRTTGRGLERPTLDLDRVLVTLRRGGGEWRVDELDAL